MVGSFFKHLKLLRNHQKLIIQLCLFWGLSGCAEAPVKTASISNDAPSDFTRDTQEKWEKNGAVASADYHFTLAQAYSTEGQVDRSIEEFRAAMAYDPKSALLHERLAAEYLKKGALSFAIEECKSALALDPKLVDVHLMLGGIYSLSNETQKAIDEYDLSLRLDPTNDEAAVFKTQVLVEKDRVDEALKFIRAFTSKVSDSAAAWFYAGKLEQTKEHVEEAIRDYRKAIELRAGFSQASLALGLIFELHGENQKALDVYETQLDEKQDTQVAGRLVTLYLKANQSEKALKLLQVMAVLDPEDLNTQLRIGLLYMQNEDWTNSQKVFEAILEKVPDSDKVHYYLAAVYEQQGKSELTVAQLKKVSIESKLFEDANLHVVALYRKLAKSELAYQTLKEAIKKSPENPGFYLTLASLYEDDKKVNEATQSLAEGLKLFPDHEKMRYFYGALLEKNGKPDEAIVEMEKIIAQSPNNADALNFVAYTWTTQGVHLKDAEDMLKKALKLKPDNPFILDSLGWNQFVLGHNKDAMIYLEKAVEIKSDEEAILEHLVEVYAKNQMPERAQTTRDKIHTIQSQANSRAPASNDVEK